MVVAAAASFMRRMRQNCTIPVIETSYLNPTLRTNADGVTTFELSVPESLPSWSLDVRAFTASADGNLLLGEKTFRPAY